MKKWLAPVLSLLVASASFASEQSLAVIEAEFWASPRHAEMVLDNAPVAAAIKRLLADPEAYIVLHYPETETGELWAQEFRAWLVSLGILSDRIELRSGFTASDGVELLIVAADSEPTPAVVSVESVENEAEVDDGAESVPVVPDSAAPVQAVDENEVELQ